MLIGCVDIGSQQSQSSPQDCIDSTSTITVELEEPGDPELRSGVRMYVGSAPEGLSVYFATHCLGTIGGEDKAVHAFVDGCRSGTAGLVLPLEELYPSWEPGRYSGAELHFTGGELRFCLGRNCLGVLRGSRLQHWLLAMASRCKPSQAEPPGNVIDFQVARNRVRAARTL